jgi:streptogramin lyase
MGTYGAGDRQFINPRGVMVDADGNIYVADSNNHRIQKLGPDGAFKWSTPGTTPGAGDRQFNNPQGVAVDTQGNIYVLDTNNHRIQKLAPDGTFLNKWGTGGVEDGYFNYPQGGALDAQGNIYVADTNNDRIQKLAPNGDFLNKWGILGTKDGQFRGPSSVTMDFQGNIYVADTSNHRIQKFAPDGTFLAKWGTPGAGDGQFRIPSSVAVDAQGNIYVADTNNHRIQKLAPNGDFLGKWGIVGVGDGQFSNPYGVMVDTQGNIYVSDYGNNRIQKFLETTGNVTIEGGLLAHGGNVNVGGSQSQHSQLTIEGQDVSLRMREAALSHLEGGLWRVRLERGILSFDTNTAAAGDFSSWASPLVLRRSVRTFTPVNVAIGTGTDNSPEVSFRTHELDRWKLHLSGGDFQVSQVSQTGDAVTTSPRLVINGAGQVSFPGGKVGYVVDHFISKAGDTVEEGDVVVISSTDTSWYHGVDNNIPLPEATVTEDAYDSRVCGIVARVVTENELPWVEARTPDAYTDGDEERTTNTAEPIVEESGVSFSDVEGTGSSGGRTAGELEPHAHPLGAFAGEITPESDAAKVEHQQMGTMVTLGAYAHCKVDADIAPVSVGDLLTTSPTKGHAQKVLETERAVGAIIGKALASLQRGKGKIPVLVMLQ